MNGGLVAASHCERGTLEVANPTRLLDRMNAPHTAYRPSGDASLPHRLQSVPRPLPKLARHTCISGRLQAGDKGG